MMQNPSITPGVMLSYWRKAPHWCRVARRRTEKCRWGVFGDDGAGHGL